MNDLDLAFALQDASRALVEAQLALILKDREKALILANKSREALERVKTNRAAGRCPCDCLCGSNCDHDVCPCTECVEYRK